MDIHNQPPPLPSQHQSEPASVARPELTSLNKAIRALTTQQDLHETLEQITVEINHMLSAESASILLYNRSSDKLDFTTVAASDNKKLIGTKLPKNVGIANWVLSEKQSVWIDEANQDPRFYSGIDSVTGTTTHSMLAVPIIFREQPIGVIEVINKKVGPFNQHDAEMVEMIANSVGIAISNDQLNRETERRTHQLTVLHELDQAIITSLRLVDIYHAFALHAARLLPYDSSILMLLDEGTIRLAYAAGEITFPLAVGATLPHRNTATSWAISHGQPLLRHDVVAMPRFIEDEHFKSTGIQAALSIPLRAKGSIIGVWHLGSRQKAAYHPDDLNIAQSMADQLAVSVENARLFEQVRAGQEQMRYLAQQVVSAQERERKRLSRELHDEAGQALTALKIALELVRRDVKEVVGEAEEIHGRIGEAVKLTERTMEQLRALAHDLRPPALDTAGLDLTLEGLCRIFARRTDFVVNYTSVNIDACPLTDLINICLYRFLQETLTNVVKHAQANRVDVKLHYKKKMISLTVQDDGLGFTKPTQIAPGERPRGIGLLGLQERLELLGGWMEIESEPGQGTLIMAYVPLEG